MSSHTLFNDSQAVRGRGIGVMFLAFFGSWWMAAGVSAIYGSNAAALAAVAVVGLGLFAAGWRQVRSGAAERATPKINDIGNDRHRAKAFRNVNIAQWGACILLVVILNTLQRAEWITPGVMFIVGVHFFPLAKLFHYRAHYITGSALAALAASYPFFAGGPGSAVGPIGAALILWVSAACMLTRAARR